MIEMSKRPKIRNVLEQEGEDFLPKTKSVKPIKSSLQDRINLKMQPLALANLSRNEENPLYKIKSGGVNTFSNRGAIKSYRSVNLP